MHRQKREECKKAQPSNVNQNANSQSSRSTAAILSGGEREKIEKHSQTCQDRRADFVPFVVTTELDGCIGDQGQNLEVFEKTRREIGREVGQGIQ